MYLSGTSRVEVSAIRKKPPYTTTAKKEIQHSSCLIFYPPWRMKKQPNLREIQSLPVNQPHPKPTPYSTLAYGLTVGLILRASFAVSLGLSITEILQANAHSLQIASGQCVIFACLHCMHCRYIHYASSYNLNARAPACPLSGRMPAADKPSASKLRFCWYLFDRGRAQSA